MNSIAFASSQAVSVLGRVVRVRTPWFPLIWHYGIVVGWNGRGELLIIHCSMRLGVVAIETITEFAQEGQTEYYNFNGELPAWEAIARAESRLGTPWHATDFNCEHFWREAHGLEPESPQLQLTVASAALGLMWLLSRNSN